MGKVAEISMLNYSAEDIFGPVSAEVGLYLMELADLRMRTVGGISSHGQPLSFDFVETDS